MSIDEGDISVICDPAYLEELDDEAHPMRVIKALVAKHDVQLALMTRALTNLGATVHSLLEATTNLSNALTAHLQASQPKPATDSN